MKYFVYVGMIQFRSKNMNQSQLIQAYLTRDKDKHQRFVGKFSASDLSSIMGGYMTPKNFFAEKKINALSAKKMITGIILEDGLTRLLENANIDFKSQQRYEIPIDDFIVVAKTDFEFGGAIYETKWTEKTIDQAMETYQWQLQLQWEATKKPVYLTKISIPFDLRAYKFEPSEERFEHIKTTLRWFHGELKKLGGQN